MTDPQFSVDALFELLQNRRRRYLLYCLDQDADEVVTLDELAEMIRDRERRTNGDIEESTAELEARIRVALHHNHLPKLEEMGLVEYDARSETVRNSEFPPVFAVLDGETDEVAHLRELFGASVTS